MAGYGADDLFEAWLTENGLTVPDAAPSSAVLRQKGSVYLDALYGEKFRGVPTGGVDQERAWPRTGATAFRNSATPVDPDTIPLAIIHASYWAAHHEANNPGSLAVSATASGAIKREIVDVIETEYFAGSGDAAADATVRLSSVDGLVAPFLLKDLPTGPLVFSIG